MVRQQAKQILIVEDLVAIHDIVSTRTETLSFRLLSRVCMM